MRLKRSGLDRLFTTLPKKKIPARACTFSAKPPCQVTHGTPELTGHALVRLARAGTCVLGVRGPFCFFFARSYLTLLRRRGGTRVGLAADRGPYHMDIYFTHRPLRALSMDANVCETPPYHMDLRCPNSVPVSDNRYAVETPTGAKCTLPHPLHSSFSLVSFTRRAAVRGARQCASGRHATSEEKDSTLPHSSCRDDLVDRLAIIIMAVLAVVGACLSLLAWAISATVTGKARTQQPYSHRRRPAGSTRCV